ncbi:hypothetical protein BDM02DRAFT_3111927, partial [Thelephora ganbajun]
MRTGKRVKVRRSLAVASPVACQWHERILGVNPELEPCAKPSPPRWLAQSQPSEPLLL